MNPTLQRLLSQARRLSRPATAAAGQGDSPLQRHLADALRAAGLPAGGPGSAPPAEPAGPLPGGLRSVWPSALQKGLAPGLVQSLVESLATFPADHPAGMPAGAAPAPSAPSEQAPGDFLQGTHTFQQLERHYRLYVPLGCAAHGRPPRALVVMLHGCTQDAEDFAAGTGMNLLAEWQDFLVLYPEQCQKANASRCWNWFKHHHQQRGRGEAALLADLSQQVAVQYGVPAGQVFVAGLSAGGAMAASAAAAYPEVFSAVGVHSGLPPGAADNLQEALAAMRNGAARGASTGVRGEPALAGATPLPVPAIVFHGDKDTTVHPRNGQQVLAAALAPAGAAGAGSLHTTEGRAGGTGRHYTRTCFTQADGSPQAEHWLVHGAGHAWSGGRAGGSYTDPEGPDASAEMVRFFFSLRG